MKDSKGFTLIELLITVLFLASLTVVATIPTWNCFYTESGVLSQLKAEGVVPESATIARTERHIFGYSKIYIKDTQPFQTDSDRGTRIHGAVRITSMFELNSNILYNYRLIGHWPAHPTPPRIP